MLMVTHQIYVVFVFLVISGPLSL